MQSTRQEKLFDYVIVVGLKEDEKTGQITPCAEYSFPPSKNDDPLISSIQQFCFPDIDQISALTTKVTRETFSFVLTEGDGSRRFGYCRRLMSEKQEPRAFCILSFFPCFSIFSQILDEVEKRSSYAHCSPNVVMFFLDAILQQPFPQPGEAIVVSVVSWHQAGVVDDFTFTRPDDNDFLFDYVDFETLLCHLSPFVILSLFVSLIVERRMIFFAEKLSTLSACVQALVALLYPLSWQHVFIPVLPNSLLTFCCATVPYIVGVLSSCQAEVLELPMEEVLIVDLDHNRILRQPSGNDYDMLPSEIAAPLLNAIAMSCQRVAEHRKKSKKNVPIPKVDFRPLSEAFVGLFVDILAPYRYFIKKGTFNQKAFIENHPEEYRALLEGFFCSQMFERFIEERLDKRVNNGLFERCINWRVTLSLKHAEGTNGTIRIKQSTAAKLLSAVRGKPLLPPGEISVVSIQEGYLKKLSRDKNWSRRWFILTAYHLCYKKFKSDRNPHVSIPLVTISSVSNIFFSESKQFCLEIVTNSRSYVLNAETKEEGEKWTTLVSTLSSAAKQASEKEKKSEENTPNQSLSESNLHEPKSPVSTKDSHSSPNFLTTVKNLTLKKSKNSSLHQSQNHSQAQLQAQLQIQTQTQTQTQTPPQTQSSLLTPPSQPQLQQMSSQTNLQSQLQKELQAQVQQLHQSQLQTPSPPQSQSQLQPQLHLQQQLNQQLMQQLGPSSTVQAKAVTLKKLRPTSKSKTEQLKSQMRHSDSSLQQQMLDFGFLEPMKDINEPNDSHDDAIYRNLQYQLSQQMERKKNTKPTEYSGSSNGLEETDPLSSTQKSNVDTGTQNHVSHRPTPPPPPSKAGIPKQTSSGGSGIKFSSNQPSVTGGPSTLTTPNTTSASNAVKQTEGVSLTTNITGLSPRPVPPKLNPGHPASLTPSASPRIPHRNPLPHGHTPPSTSLSEQQPSLPIPPISKDSKLVHEPATVLSPTSKVPTVSHGPPSVPPPPVPTSLPKVQNVSHNVPVVPPPPAPPIIPKVNSSNGPPTVPPPPVPKVNNLVNGPPPVPPPPVPSPSSKVNSVSNGPPLVPPPPVPPPPPKVNNPQMPIPLTPSPTPLRNHPQNPSPIPSPKLARPSKQQAVSQSNSQLPQIPPSQIPAPPVLPPHNPPSPKPKLGPTKSLQFQLTPKDTANGASNFDAGSKDQPTRLFSSASSILSSGIDSPKATKAPGKLPENLRNLAIPLLTNPGQHTTSAGTVIFATDKAK